MNKAEKTSEIGFIRDSFTKAQVALCADYRGLTVAEVTQLRKDLRQSGAKARVVKNTLAKISAKEVFGSAGKGEDFENFLKIFHGPSLLVTSETDPVAPAKVLAKFMKDKKKLSVKGAWLDGSFLDNKGVDSLAAMPGRQETLAKLLYLLSAPATQFVRLLKEPGAQLVRTIEAHRKNLEQKGA